MMRFLKWLKLNKSLQQRVEKLEKQNENLISQLSTQNEALTEVISCIKKLAEVDQSLYYDIAGIASMVKRSSPGDALDEYLYADLDNDPDEYLN